MKQAVWIKWFLDDLGRLSEENIKNFGIIKTLPLLDFAREAVGGKIDLSKPENKLKVLEAQLNQIFDNFETQEFKNAVNVLNGKVNRDAR